MKINKRLAKLVVCKNVVKQFMTVALLYTYILCKVGVELSFFVYFKLNIKSLKMLKHLNFHFLTLVTTIQEPSLRTIILTSTYQKNKSIILTSCLLEMSILGLINQLWAIFLFLELLILRFLQALVLRTYMNILRNMVQ